MGFAVLFLVGHWYVSLFFQSFYLHRYVSHRMFKLSPFWNRTFCLLTILTQGASFLRPALYRSLHMKHHLYSDGEHDPHSPHHHKNMFDMMKRTLSEYLRIKDQKEEFPRMVGFFDSMWVRTAFGFVYALIYLCFTDSLWYLCLTPVNIFMGPIHGAIVNWFGHKKGYRNYEIDDQSKNTLTVDFIMMGELYQNNHHAFPHRSKFSIKPWEIDLTYVFIAFFRKICVVGG